MNPIGWVCGASLPEAEAREDPVEHMLRSGPARELVQGPQSATDGLGQEIEPEASLEQRECLAETLLDLSQGFEIAGAEEHRGTVPFGAGVEKEEPPDALAQLL